jgi:DNA-binding response OmpR family regulator
MSGTRTTEVASGAVRQPQPLTLALVAAGKELHGIELVERGLDAYMVVPCGAREFAARVRALLRRTRGSDAAPERRDATSSPGIPDACSIGRHCSTRCGVPTRSSRLEAWTPW